MFYHALGMVSSSLFILSILGLYLQLRTIVKRRTALCAASPSAFTSATETLSLNRLVSSFFAFYSFLLYGLILQTTDLYLVFSRVAAVFLALWILYEVMLDRRSRIAALAFVFTTSSMLVPIVVVVFGLKNDAMRNISQILVVGVAMLLTQGYVHQIRSVLRSNSAGAINAQTHQLFLLKDAATGLFALTLGFQNGWPILFMSITSAICQASLLYCLRRQQRI